MYSPLSALMLLNGSQRFILLGALMSRAVTGITLDAIPLQDVKYFDAVGKWQHRVEDNNRMAILQFQDQNNNNVFKKKPILPVCSPFGVPGFTPAGNVIPNNEF